MEDKDLESRLALLERRTERSINERGKLQAIVCVAAIAIFGIGFKVTTDETGNARYGWNLDSAVIVNLLTILVGGGAVTTGLMATKNLTGGSDGKSEQ
jgi:hypothetical protein